MRFDRQPPAPHPRPLSASASDEELAQRFVGGERRAYDLLADRYLRPLYNFAFRLLGNAADAEDVTQETLVQLYQHLPALQTDQPIRPWLYRVARNRCLDLLRRRRSTPLSELASPESEEDAPEPSVVDPTPLPEDLVERADLQEILQAAFAALPDHYRQVVALRYTTDLTFAEMGAVLGLPENTVKTHFQRAKGVLRERLRALVG